MIEEGAKMEQGNNKNGLVVLLMTIIVILVVLCVLFATGIINLKSDVKCKDTPMQSNDNIVDTDSLDHNIIITRNGKVISNEIPSDLIGKYTNVNATSDDYFEFTNSSMTLAMPNCSGSSNVYKDDQLKVYINYLNDSSQVVNFITVVFYYDDGQYQEYLGSEIDGKYDFRTIQVTCSGGEGNVQAGNPYPYKKS